MPQLFHHGAINGVTGSCHEIRFDENEGILVDCGLFQGHENKLNFEHQIPFEIHHIKALLVTHVHIDHIGRIPHLYAHGYQGPIFCSEASAKLLPLVLEDALKVGFTRQKSLIQKALKVILSKIEPVPYKKWISLPIKTLVKARFQPAGHILGSSFIELDLKTKRTSKRVVFSGDLGAHFTPLLPGPKPPAKADTLIMESTYGDRNHLGREKRVQRLKKLLEKCFKNKGLVLIPAFSIGRTQELLYELESIIHDMHHKAPQSFHWDFLDIVVDSPMANQFTQHYIEMKELWDREAKQRDHQKRHPLDFEQVITLNTHREHEKAIESMSRAQRPAIVIAASGMCNGGRILNWIERNIENPIVEILLVGYQAKGTLGRELQNPHNKNITIGRKAYHQKAKVYSLSAYSAHADQTDLVQFATQGKSPASKVVLVHGINSARRALSKKLKEKAPKIDVISPNQAQARQGYPI